MELLVTTVVSTLASGVGMCNFRDQARNFLEDDAPSLDPGRAGAPDVHVSLESGLQPYTGVIVVGRDSASSCCTVFFLKGLAISE